MLTTPGICILDINVTYIHTWSNVTSTSMLPSQQYYTHINVTFTPTLQLRHLEQVVTTQ